MTARRAARGGAVLAAGATALLASAVPAAAQEAPAPERTAFYSAASGGGLAAPQPTANDGDLRVSRTVRTENFAALLYQAEGVRASLDLTIRDVPPPAGTPDVVVCPTVGTEWEAGPNQPVDAAPEYDCEAGIAFGVPSEDGLTVSFALDRAFQVAPGTWSMVVVPTPYELQVVVDVPKVPAPFSLDFAAPAAGAFVVEPEFVTPTLEEPGSDPGTTDGTTGGGTGEAFLPGGFEAPPTFDGGTAEAPLVAGGLDAALPEPASAPEPAVAAGAPTAAVPLLVARPAGVVQDLGSGRRLLALLVLAGGSAAVGYAAGQQRPGPRLIGGRSRAVVPSAVPALAGPAPAEERPRGIGRFAKTRDAAPRRLR